MQESAQDVLASLQPLLSQLPASDPVAQEVAEIATLVGEEQVTVSGSTVTDVLTRLLLRVPPGFAMTWMPAYDVLSHTSIMPGPGFSALQAMEAMHNLASTAIPCLCTPW